MVCFCFKFGVDGIDLFNKAAAACYAGASTCPTKQLGMTLDGKVISAPTIQAASFSPDQIQISGSFTEKTAKELATQLRYGALPVELEPQQVQLVSATLGEDALHAGLIAGLVALVLVTIYMVAWYRILGPGNRKLTDEKSPAGKTDYHTMGACYEVLKVL